MWAKYFKEEERMVIESVTKHLNKKPTKEDLEKTHAIRRIKNNNIDVFYNKKPISTFQITL